MPIETVFVPYETSSIVADLEQAIRSVAEKHRASPGRLRAALSILATRPLAPTTERYSFIESSGARPGAHVTEHRPSPRPRGR